MARVNSAKIGIGESDALGKTIQSYLEEYDKDVALITQQCIDDIGKEGAKQLQKSSPVGKGHGGRKGHYYKGWAYKKGTMKRAQYEGVLYNKNKPGLAHLLENEHDLVDRSGNMHGKSNPKKHIEPVDQWVEQELPKRISQKIS